ncbi:unnamed protein product [Schistosoma margrebowiei]|uniref:PDEase domain-containing protein n=1 Tax=Schistosoma margrebowiei TaxID=48269 RepID=A0A183M8T2_9TREM|nr:unnamed protein product [Schistosoma margrebowiei]
MNSIIKLLQSPQTPLSDYNSLKKGQNQSKSKSDREKLEGLPVAPFMDREKVTKPSAQIGFIKFVLIPMFQTVASVYPIIDELMITQLKSALERYEKMLAEEEEAKRNLQMNEAD